MKLRIEPEGLHFYSRKSGTHLLIDEIKTKESDYSIAPRAVSIAITDECDFSCSFCYVNLRDRYLSKNKIISICKELDELGTLDIAFGGGEPTLHPDLAEICKTVWNETKLGISITTHGHNLTDELINQLQSNISLIRVSIDGIEPYYSKFRDKPLSELLPRLKKLNGKIPFGINMVVNSLTISHLDEIKKLVKEYNAIELLLLPMYVKEKFTLKEKEWIGLNNWINENKDEIPIRISVEAKQYLELPYLFDNERWDKDYGSISIDLKFKDNSFTEEGIDMKDFDSMKDILEFKKKNTACNKV